MYHTTLGHVLSWAGRLWFCPSLCLCCLSSSLEKTIDWTKRFSGMSVTWNEEVLEVGNYNLSSFFIVHFQSLMLLLQNLPTHNWDSTDISLIVAEAFRLKYTFDSAPRHLSNSWFWCHTKVTYRDYAVGRGYRNKKKTTFHSKSKLNLISHHLDITQSIYFWNKSSQYNHYIL